MHAEIISIGSELTSGAKLDTNSQWLSIELSDLGIPVHFHSTMADDRVAMLEVFRTASLRSDLVLITGGLGPTLDDLTRQLIAELMNVDLELDTESLDFIRGLFEKRGRVMAPRNEIQAKFPVGSDPLFNPIGTAPGIWAEIPRSGRSPCLVAAMPGVPSEMKRMFKEQVVPRIPYSGRVIRRGCVHCFGRGESDIEQDLGQLTARGRNPEVGITASSATITLRIAATASTEKECLEMIDADRAEIRRVLGEIVFGDDDDTLEGVVAQLLTEQQKTLAVVEITTGGVLSQMLHGLVPEAAFVGGLVSSSSRRLAELLDQNITAAKEFAMKAKEYFRADYALAVTESSSETDKRSPECQIAIAGPDGLSQSVTQSILQDMTLARPRAAKTALNLLRLNLLSRPDGSANA